MRVITRMNVGGPVLQIQALMKELSAQNFEQLLVYGKCSSDEVEFPSLSDIQGEKIFIESLSRTLNIFNDIRSIVILRRIIRDFQPDILHSHTSKAGLIGRIASLSVSRRPKLVHTFHGHVFSGYFRPLISRILVVVEVVLSRFTDTIIGVGTSTTSELLSHKIGNQRKNITINPGIYEQKSETVLSRSDLGIADQKFVCVWIGRLTKIKRPDRLIEIAKLSQDKPNLHFVVVGGGELLPDTLENSNSLLNIQFLGWRNDVENILRICDILIMTSENEGVPIVAIQAHRLGKPVLATKVGSMDDIVLNNITGFSINYNPESFCGKIDQLANDKKRYFLFSEAAKHFSNKNFTPELLATKHTQVYESLI